MGKVLTKDQMDYIIIILEKHAEKIKDVAWREPKMGMQQAEETKTIIDTLKDMKLQKPEDVDISLNKQELFFDEVRLGKNGKLVGKFTHPKSEKEEPLIGV